MAKLWAKGPIHTSRGRCPKLRHSQNVGQRPNSYQTGATPRENVHKQTTSANGAVHPCGIVCDGMMDAAWAVGWGGLSALGFWGCVAWGVAPGWYDGAPLALTEAITTCPQRLWHSVDFGPKARVIPGLRQDENVGQRPNSNQRGATPRGLRHGEIVGQWPDSYQPGATPVSHIYKQTMSANGAVHPAGLPLRRSE